MHALPATTSALGEGPGVAGKPILPAATAVFLVHCSTLIAECDHTCGIDRLFPLLCPCVFPRNLYSCVRACWRHAPASTLIVTLVRSKGGGYHAWATAPLSMSKYTAEKYLQIGAHWPCAQQAEIRLTDKTTTSPHTHKNYSATHSRQPCCIFERAAEYFA